MVITPSAALANATAALWLTQLQAGASASVIEFYTGSKPLGPSVAPNGTTQIKLGTCTCSTSPDVGVVTGAELAFGTVTQDAAADADGTATWARVLDGNALAVIDVDVSDIAGNAFLKLNTTSIRVGGPISISSFKINF